MKEFTVWFLLCVVICFLCLYYSGFFKKRSSKISFNNTFNKTRLPIICLYNNNQKLNFVVDSGSTASFIIGSVLPKLNIEDIESVITEETSFHSTLTKSADIVTLVLHSKHEKFVHTFYKNSDLEIACKSVSEDLGEKVCGILGSDFLIKYNRIVDFKKLEICSNDNKG